MVGVREAFAGDSTPPAVGAIVVGALAFLWIARRGFKSILG